MSDTHTEANETDDYVFGNLDDLLTLSELAEALPPNLKITRTKLNQWVRCGVGGVKLPILKGGQLYSSIDAVHWFLRASAKAHQDKTTQREASKRRAAGIGSVQPANRPGQHEAASDELDEMGL